jgi:hypothetical protein
MSNDDDTERPSKDLGWSRGPEAMRPSELRERLVREWSGSSKEDAWAQKPRKRWRLFK